MNNDLPCGPADDVSLRWKSRKSLGQRQEKCRDASSPRRYPALLWEASLWVPQALPRLVVRSDMALKQHLQYTTQNVSQFTDRRSATTLVQTIVLCRRKVDVCVAKCCTGDQLALLFRSQEFLGLNSVSETVYIH
jgi:hypothetical protein